ncbi:MAG: SprB repeat-containing protein [Flavobacteriales bacterium]|nr:SprB repeat-containing protein [Flavobacteriales bacterium]
MIDYTIRFQNTGTDTAFLVVITDTLPQHLDPSTIRMGAGSHGFSWSLSGQGTLRWVFPNILLPDSNVNEPRSHGFVSFRIRPYEPLLPGTTIENTANIHFDFNPPVVTEPSVLVAEFSTRVAGYPVNTIQGLACPREQVRLNISASSPISSLRVVASDGPSPASTPDSPPSPDVAGLQPEPISLRYDTRKVPIPTNASSSKNDTPLLAPLLIVASPMTRDRGLTVTIQHTDAVCTYATGSAFAIASGGAPPYTYQWSNGATGTGILDVPAGTYSVTVVDALAEEVMESVTILAQPYQLQGGGGVRSAQAPPISSMIPCSTVRRSIVWIGLPYAPSRRF